MRNIFIFALMLLPFINTYSQDNVKIKSGAAQLNTWIYPNPTKDTIILLHGGPGVPTPMDSVINLLKDYYQVIFFQQRGAGNSYVENESYDIEDYLTDINSIASYFNLNQFHLFGHSWGGLYAQIYAQEYPENIKSLFLSNPSSGTGYQWDETEDEVMEFNRSKVSFWQFVSMGYFSIAGMLGSDGAYQCLFRIVLSNYNDGFIVSEEDLSWMEGIHSEPINETRKNISIYPPLENVNSLKFPVTIIYGEKDIYGESSEYVKKRYQGAQIFTIENSGHIPWLHNKNRFVEILYSHYGIKKDNSTNYGSVKRS